MKAKGMVGLVLGVLLALPAQAAQPLTTQPQVAAKAAVVMDAQSGRVIFWQNADQPMPMASTTKIMTTLLALEQQDLDRPFVVDPQAIRTEGSSMGLQQGDTVTLRALCYGMMLASGNDAANAAAVRCAGSMEDFVADMNSRAQMLKMENTCFVTPSGLDAQGHQSTAYDMALLMQAALKQPDFCEIASAKTKQLEYGNPPYARTLTNHNKLLWNCEGVVAGKTGFTKTAGRCLVSAAQRQDITLVCVTLGCPDDWNVHAQLYDQCFGLLQPQNPANLVGERYLPVAGGGRLKVTAGETLTLALTEEEAKSLQTKVLLPHFVYAPISTGQVVGKLECRIGEVLVYSCPMVAAHGVGAKSAPPPQTRWQKLWGRIRGI